MLGLGQNQCHGHTIDIHHNSEQKKNSEKDFSRISQQRPYYYFDTCIGMYLLYQGMYTLQILPTANLVDQN